MMRPSSEEPTVNWNNHGPVREDAGERVFDDELIDDPESDARTRAPFNLVPLIWGAAAFAGVVAVGLVLRSRRRRPRWPALFNVTIASPPPPTSTAMLSTIGGAVARFAVQRLMAAQQEAMANLDPDVDGRGWKAEGGTAVRSSSSAEYNHGS
jgi:hypothetical protein